MFVFFEDLRPLQLTLTGCRSFSLSNRGAKGERIEWGDVLDSVGDRTLLVARGRAELGPSVVDKLIEASSRF